MSNCDSTHNQSFLFSSLICNPPVAAFAWLALHAMTAMAHADCKWKRSISLENTCKLSLAIRTSCLNSIVASCSTGIVALVHNHFLSWCEKWNMEQEKDVLLLKSMHNYHFPKNVYVPFSLVCRNCKTLKCTNILSKLRSPMAVDENIQAHYHLVDIELS
jgi:hypothetical protein